jgi:hypothetical protein
MVEEKRAGGPTNGVGAPARPTGYAPGVGGAGDSPASGRAKLAASALCAERELGQANRLPHPTPA